MFLDSSQMEEGHQVAYSDRPAPIEPGLGNDIIPINSMVVKLAIQELLKGKPTTLRSLDADLIAPLFLWVNRRDEDSPYAGLEPMAFNTDRFSVMRWYGIPLERFLGCPACGDYAGYMSSRMGLSVSQEDVAAFAPSTADGRSSVQEVSR